MNCRANFVVRVVRAQDSHAEKLAGAFGNDDARHAKLRCDGTRNSPPAAAIGQQHEFARIEPTLHGHLRIAFAMGWFGDGYDPLSCLRRIEFSEARRCAL